MPIVKTKIEDMRKKLNCTLLIDDDVVSNFVSEKVIQGSEITRELKVAQNGHVAIKYLEKCSSAENALRARDARVCPEAQSSSFPFPIDRDQPRPLTSPVLKLLISAYF